MATTDQFSGAKAALFVGDKLLLLLRDDFDDIPLPNLWDLPGGAREGDETPFETLARETMEEIRLRITPGDVVWKRAYPSAHDPGATIWFYVVKLPAKAVQDIVFGEEGQGWGLITLEGFLKLRQVVPSYAPRLRDWLAEGGIVPSK